MYVTVNFERVDKAPSDATQCHAWNSFLKSWYYLDTQRNIQNGRIFIAIVVHSTPQTSECQTNEPTNFSPHGNLVWICKTLFRHPAEWYGKHNVQIGHQMNTSTKDEKLVYLERTTLCLVSSFEYAAIISYGVTIPINLKANTLNELL